MASDDNLCKYYSHAINLCKEAGKMILERGFAKDKIQTKSAINDFVTEIDVKVEKFFRAELEKLFPETQFIGEESVSADGKCNFTEAPTWVIDPIDGTTNFIHGFPHCCISLALFVDKEPVIGIIYNPSLDQMFTARKGLGAFLNKNPIKVSDCKEIKDSLLLLAVNPASLENIQKLVPIAHGIRNLGSAALNMAMVAMGGADSYTEIGIHIWDFAAGTIIVREAGGVVVDTSGGPLNYLSRRLLACSSQELAEELSKHLTQTFPPSD